MEDIRSQFPSLNRKGSKREVVYMDGPGGTQVPESVIRAMDEYYHRSNANTHGSFLASQETDEVLDRARKNIADLLGAEGPDSISIGQNMTSLCFSLSRGFSRMFQPGDEVIITQLDHEANRGPWMALRENGVLVKEIPLLSTGELDLEQLDSLLNHRTRLVAIGWASNALGTINDLEKARKLINQSNALMLVDAVHFAPHFSIDVQKLGCDLLLCSSYKFYGPHLGFLYAKPGLLDRIPTDRLVTAAQQAPYSIETGTLNHAAIAGAASAVEFLSNIGEGKDLREKLVTAYESIGRHEKELATKLYDGLSSIPGVNVVGQPMSIDQLRAPTLSFTHDKYTATEVCDQLAVADIHAWDGHFYAIRAIQVLGLLEMGGVTRLGISVYNTVDEIDHVLNTIEGL